MKGKRKGAKSLECSNALHSYDPDDRISRLPDDILVHILCSMTIKEATVTSLLSRRWRYLSAFLPRLDFSYSILLDKSPIYLRAKQVSEFLKRVKKVIKLHKGHNVEDFRLRFDMRKTHTKFVDHCVQFALYKQLKNLELDFNHPLGLYNNGENYVFRVEDAATTPTPPVCWSFVGFKSLNSLCFKSVVMGGDVLEGLLSNCSVLEKLTLCHVSNLGCVKVVGPSLRLKHLEMVSCPGLNEIEIHDAPIVSMKRWRCGEAAIRMNKVPHLVELSMSTSLKVADEIPLFSSCLSQLESLKLRVSSLYDRKPLEHNVLSMVSKLTKLREMEISCEPDLVKDLLLLVPLIEAPPHLHKIVIRVLLGWKIREDAASNKPREVERRVGVLEHLKVLEFAGYRFGVIEDEFISCISNNAAALETIIIDPSYQHEPSSWPPEAAKANKVAEEVWGCAKKWLEKIIPPTVELVIQCVNPLDLELFLSCLLLNRNSNEEKEKDDRISRLPDDILLHILCFMKIKEATATSILSRRWRYMCASLPRLDLDHYILIKDKSPLLHRPKHESEFIKRGRKIIKSHKGNNVEDFRLSFALRKVHTGFLDQCVQFALSNKVQKLELDLNLPLGIYNPAEPYVFHAVALNKATDPSFDGFKLLKSLCLKSVMVANDVLESLLSICTVLETLILSNVSNLGYVKVVGPASKLKHLEMVSCPDLKEIEICDAPIVSMKRWWCGEVAIKMNKVPHLVELSMSTCLKAADEIPFFSSCLSQLESLKLRLSSLYVHNPLEEHIVLSMFSKLTKLRELEILCETDLVKDLILLVPLIEALPQLHKLVIRVLRSSTTEERTLEEAEASFSNLTDEVEGRVGLLEHLKVLEFAGYRNVTTEDEFILLIVKNAAALETVIIDPGYQNEPSYLPPGEVALKADLFAWVAANAWLEKIIPPRVELVIKDLKPVDFRKLQRWDEILRTGLSHNIGFLALVFD
ncbi:F-box/FBD/LRR-repeat protein At5g56420 [Linum perenne]